MEHYWISFRVHENQTRQERYNSLVEAVRTGCDGWWAETTSFYLAVSDMGISDLCRHLTAGLDASVDTLVMRYLSKDGSRYFGKIDNLEILKQHLPKIAPI